MMPILINLFALLTIWYSSVQTYPSEETSQTGSFDQVEFLSISLEEAIKQSQSTQKPLFISLYATWCAPCKVMKIRTFTNDGLATILNQEYIAIRLNGEEDEGRELMDKMNLNAFPTQLIFAPDGQMVWGKSGYMNAKELTQVTQSIQ